MQNELNEAKFFIKLSEFHNLANIMNNLPNDIKPIEYSEEEESKRVKIELDIYDKIENVVGFLWAKNCDYFIEIYSSEIFCLNLSNVSSHNIEYFMSVITNIDIEFGFACDYAEYLHRNKLFLETAFGSIEAWVGRNYELYIPGLYWITHISSNLVKKHKINYDDLANHIYSIEVKQDDALHIKAYENPEDWIKYSKEIDEFCVINKGFFAKLTVEEQVRGIKDFMGLADIVGNYP